MGNTASASDRALDACASGDVRTLQSSAELKLVLDARDKEGRSCLTIAAMRNHVNIAKLLLQHGADVHYICKMAARSTTALHEAASRRHAEMVELLLQYGANPFLGNSHGETPMELAVLAGAIKLVHIFERHALFVGQVEVQWTKLIGGPAYKARRVIIMDHYPCPKPGQPLPPTRQQLWISSTDRDDIMPKCRVWLDGAMAFRVGSGSEAVLRLAHTHVQPVSKIYTRFSNGYCLFLRAPTAGMQGGSWDRLLQLCHVNDALSVPTIGPALKGASGSALPVGILPAAAPPSPARPASVPITPRGGTHGASAAAAAPQQSAHSYPTVPNLAMPLPAPPAAAAGGPQGNQGYLWGMPPPGHTQQQLGPAAAQRQPGITTTGGFGASPGLDMSSALPGESDAAFAARLAALSAGGGYGAPSGGAGAGAGAGASRAAAAVDMHALNMAAAALRAPGGGGAERQAGPSRPQAQYGGSGAGLWPPPPPPPPMLHPEHAPSAPPLLPTAPPPPRPAATPAAAAPGSEVDDSCVICMSAPREAGFLHGGTVHRCVCNGCAKIFDKDRARKDLPCPVCRQPVEQIITIF